MQAGPMISYGSKWALCSHLEETRPVIHVGILIAGEMSYRALCEMATGKTQGGS
jgi:hypothetical protein